VQAYQVADLRVVSPVPLPGVERTPHTAGAWHLTMHPSRTAPVPDSWYHEATEDGAPHPWRRIGRSGSLEIVAFRPEGTFVIDRRARRVMGYPHPHLRRDALCQTLIGQLLPLLLSLSGRLVLHASAVRTPGGVIALIGKSGAGKSTLAAALATAGFPLATDDCIALIRRGGRWRGVPFHSGVRLWQDSAQRIGMRLGAYHDGQKIRFSARDLGAVAHARSAPLARIYVLHPEAPAGRGRPRVEPIAPGDAVFDLVRGGFHPAVGERRAMRRLFESITDLASAIAVRRVRYARRLERLADLSDAIIEDTMTS
jgi:hypothetical protein